MSTPPVLSQADQARVTGILDAVTALNQAVATVSTQTGVGRGTLAGTVLANITKPAELATALTTLLHHRAVMRAIWAKLTVQERVVLGLTQEG